MTATADTPVPQLVAPPIEIRAHRAAPPEARVQATRPGLRQGIVFHAADPSRKIPIVNMVSA